MRGDLSVLGVAMLWAAAPGLAAHTPGAVQSRAEVTASATDNINDGSAFIVWNNGALVGTPILFSTGLGTATLDAGPSSPGAPDNFARGTATSPVSGVSSFASASLTRGELKAVVEVERPSFFTAGTGIAIARLSDAIWFTNSSASALPVTLSMRVEGRISGPDIATANGFSQLNISSGGAGCNAFGLCITPDAANPQFGYSANLFGDFDQRSPRIFGLREQGAGTENGDIAWWTFSFGAGHDPALGAYDFTKSIQLWVPTGETTLNLLGTFRLICAGTLSCDFGNTSSLSLGALPAGLSFGSQSGSFLSGLGGPAVVPEPASWAMLIAGFGLIGAALRRRRAALA